MKNIVFIIGANIAAGIFPNQDPIGKEIIIGGRKANVIGVIKKEGESLLGISFDYQAITPFNFARYIIDTKSENSDPTIYVKAKNNISNVEMMDELTGLMRAIRKIKPIAEPNFALNETSLLSKGFDSLFEIIGIAGWIIGGFSILVGGFGIANIMFVYIITILGKDAVGMDIGLTGTNIILGFTISILIGIISGFIPAYSASQLDPVEAIRTN